MSSASFLIFCYYIQYIFWLEASNQDLLTSERNGCNRNWLTLMHVRTKAFKHSCLIADRPLNHLKHQHTSLGASAHDSVVILPSEKSTVKDQYHKVVFQSKINKEICYFILFIRIWSLFKTCSVFVILYYFHIHCNAVIFTTVMQNIFR